MQRYEIYRIKGFVAVPHKAMRLVVQGVGNRFDSFYDRPWQADEPRHTRLVFIGDFSTPGAGPPLSQETLTMVLTQPF